MLGSILCAHRCSPYWNRIAHSFKCSLSSYGKIVKASLSPRSNVTPITLPQRLSMRNV